MMLEGKSLHEWINQPGAGVFTKAAREQIDPLWGTLEGDLKEFNVTIRCDYSGSCEATVVVEALNKDHARSIAYKNANEDDFKGDFDILCEYANLKLY